MDLTLCVGAKRIKIEVNSDCTARALMDIVFEKTQINSINQKLIHKGVEISKNCDEILTDLKIKDGSKIMVIGKRFDEEEEMLLKKFAKIDCDVVKINETIEKNEDHAKSIMNGFIQDNLKEKSCNDIRKQVLSSSAMLMNKLEIIDGLTIDSKFSDAKKKRKTLVDKIQIFMDKCDRINEILESGP